ncbi:MAG TPA: hypothetical protein PKE31_11595 [Pseudomonadota bacterium]|nr:hypothetical protein [Pseudomonadota bacterium]
MSLNRQAVSLHVLSRRTGWLVAASLLFCAAISAASPAILVLGVKREGHVAVKARAAVSQQLSRMGETALAPNLSPAELSCEEKSCFVRLGKDHGTQLFLGGEIFPNDRSYLIRLWMYDLVGDVLTLLEERCNECGEAQLIEAVSHGAGRLLDAFALKASALGTGGAASVSLGGTASKAAETGSVTNGRTKAAEGVNGRPASQDEELFSKPSCIQKTYSFQRGVFAGLFSALGLTGLASGIALSALDGKVYLPADGGAYPSDLLYRFSTAAQSLFGVGAVGTLGGAFLFAPWERLHKELPECPRPQQGRWTFRRGVAVGAFGGMSLVGVAVSGALAGLDGKTWGFNQIGTPFPYETRTASQVGFGATAVMAMGFGLSLAIP